MTYAWKFFNEAMAATGDDGFVVREAIIAMPLGSSMDDVNSEAKRYRPGVYLFERCYLEGKEGADWSGLHKAIDAAQVFPGWKHIEPAK